MKGDEGRCREMKGATGRSRERRGETSTLEDPLSPYASLYLPIPPRWRIRRRLPFSLAMRASARQPKRCTWLGSGLGLGLELGYP